MKGRHPLLKDVDVNINPSKDLAFVEGREPNMSDYIKLPLNLPSIVNVNGHTLSHLTDTVGKRDIATDVHLRSARDLLINKKHDLGRAQEKNEVLQETTSVAAEVVKEEVVNYVDNERGELLQTAEVVMKMLDVTNPDSLTDEQKKKVMLKDCLGDIIIRATYNLLKLCSIAMYYSCVVYKL